MKQLKNPDKKKNYIDIKFLNKKNGINIHETYLNSRSNSSNYPVTGQIQHAFLWKIAFLRIFFGMVLKTLMPKICKYRKIGKLLYFIIHKHKITSKNWLRAFIKHPIFVESPQDGAACNLQTFLLVICFEWKKIMENSMKIEKSEKYKKSISTSKFMILSCQLF